MRGEVRERGVYVGEGHRLQTGVGAAQAAVHLGCGKWSGRHAEQCTDVRAEQRGAHDLEASMCAAPLEQGAGAYELVEAVRQELVLFVGQGVLGKCTALELVLHKRMRCTLYRRTGYQAGEGKGGNQVPRTHQARAERGGCLGGEVVL